MASSPSSSSDSDELSEPDLEASPDEVLEFSLFRGCRSPYFSCTSRFPVSHSTLRLSEASRVCILTSVQLGSFLVVLESPGKVSIDLKI